MKELWAIDVETLQTYIFTRLTDEGYLELRLVEEGEVLAPRFPPEIAVKMSELQLV